MKKDIPERTNTGHNSAESSVLFNIPHVKPPPEVIPQWISNKKLDSEDGQKLHIPQSDTEMIVAKAFLSKTICCNTLFATGEFMIEWNESSAVTRVVSRERLEDYCKQASEHCKNSMERVVFI